MEPLLSIPPSSLTRADWVRIYDEATVAFWELTPEARWQRAAAHMAAFLAAGGRLDDDLSDDGILNEDTPSYPPLTPRA